VRQHQQGLLSDREAPPSDTALDAPLTQRIGQRVFGPRRRLGQDRVALTEDGMAASLVRVDYPRHAGARQTPASLLGHRLGP
jgi:hypothetical protein